MKIQKGIVKYKDRNDLICTYAVTDDGKQYFFLDENGDKRFNNGSRIASTELVEAVDPMVKASHIGIIDNIGQEVIPFVNKSIKPINDSVVLVELSEPVSQSVIEAVSLKSDPLSATKLVSTPAAIKEKINLKMGNEGRYLFNDQFSEVTICDINGNNLINNEYYSFVGINADKLYLSKNTIDSDVVEYTVTADGIIPASVNSELDVVSAQVPVDTVENAFTNEQVVQDNNYETVTSLADASSTVDNNVPVDNGIANEQAYGIPAIPNDMVADAMPEVPAVAPDAMPEVPAVAPDAMPEVPAVTPDAMPEVPAVAPDVMPEVPAVAPDAMPEVPAVADNSTGEVVVTPENNGFANSMFTYPEDIYGTFNNEVTSAVPENNDNVVEETVPTVPVDNQVVEIPSVADDSTVSEDTNVYSDVIPVVEANPVETEDIPPVEESLPLVEESSEDNSLVENESSNELNDNNFDSELKIDFKSDNSGEELEEYDNKNDVSEEVVDDVEPIHEIVPDEIETVNDEALESDDLETDTMFDNMVKDIPTKSKYNNYDLDEDLDLIDDYKNMEYSVGDDYMDNDLFERDVKTSTVSNDSIMADVAKSLSSLMKQNRNQKNTISEYQNKLNKISASRRSVIEKNKAQEQKIEMQEQRLGIQEQKIEVLSSKNKTCEATISNLESKLRALESRLREQDKLIANQNQELDTLRPQKDDLAKLIADAQALLGDDDSSEVAY